MADRQLRTLDDITDAREDLYNKLMANEIQPDRAAVIEKVLRGQTHNNAELPLKFLAMIMGNKRFEVFAAEVAARVSTYVNGPAALRA